MGREVEACAECSRNCSMIHRKHDPSPIVFSFFKVMYGKQFSELVIVPPRFTKLASLVSQKTCLEDTNGRKWNVVLSNVNGSLAFRKGWDEFSRFHGIQLGDFVVFHYIMGSHFVAKIYGKSGCERLGLSTEKSNNQNKKAKLTKDFDARNGYSDSIHEETQPPRKERLAAHPVSQPDIDVAQIKAADTPEDLCMIIRDTSFAKEDDRVHLFDLSTFEMPANNVDTDKKAGTVQDRTEVASTDDVKMCHIAQGKNAVSASSKYDDKADVSRNPRSFPSVAMFSDFKMRPQTPDLLTAPDGKTRVFKQGANFSRDFPGKTVAETYNNVLQHYASVSKYSKEAKINIKELREDHMMIDQGNAIMKPEPVDLCDSSSVHLIRITCSVKPDSKSFLELPEGLPIRAYKKGANHQEQKLVFLRDPARRLWPVVYHERDGFKVLASGWKSFRKANNIQPGQECTFLVENIYEAIFQVQIIRT